MHSGKKQVTIAPKSGIPVEIRHDGPVSDFSDIQGQIGPDLKDQTRVATSLASGLLVHRILTTLKRIYHLPSKIAPLLLSFKNKRRSAEAQRAGGRRYTNAG